MKRSTAFEKLQQKKVRLGCTTGKLFSAKNRQKCVFHPTQTTQKTTKFSFLEKQVQLQKITFSAEHETKKPNKRKPWTESAHTFSA